MNFMRFSSIWCVDKSSGKRSGDGLAPHPGFSRRFRALHGRFGRLRIVSPFYPNETEEIDFLLWHGPAISSVTRSDRLFKKTGAVSLQKIGGGHEVQIYFNPFRFDGLGLFRFDQSLRPGQVEFHLSEL
jgi:hypothetical protein